MNDQLKQLIVKELKTQSAHLSQNKVAAKIDISPATVSAMINGHWKLIKSDMWRKAKVNLRIDPNWTIVKTSNYRTLMDALDAVQERSMSIGISEKAGVGKSQIYKAFARTRKNVIHIECKNYWTKKSYMRALCMATGLDNHGTTEQLIERFMDHQKCTDLPMLIIDQIDKLKDPQFDLFMDFYNELFGHCAFVLSGVLALKKRILRGVQCDKIGYREIWSRIGSKFYDKLTLATIEDIALICQANQVDDRRDIQEIYALSGGDLRKVRREIEKLQLINKEAA